jgi:drug/metabolite transporter (DMT)-like permease
MLVVLAAIWGSSFMFIKVAVEHLHPETVVFGRLVFAVATLGLVLRWRGQLGPVWHAFRSAPWRFVIASATNVAIPFWLLAWGETRIDSGTAALLQASSPVFTAAFAGLFARTERVGGLQLLGVAIGFGGVAVLVGATPRGSVLAALACTATGAAYAVGALYTARRLRSVPSIVISFWMTAIGLLVWAPAGIARMPAGWPGWEAVGSLVALGVPALCIAYLLYFALITQAGAVRAMLVTYLVPPLALIYGALILREHIGASDLVGLLLILLGVGLGAGGLRLRRTAVARLTADAGAGSTGARD